jgi:hypothetical protein
MVNDKQIIGKAEVIELPELGVDNICARIDTGAKTSAIWVSKVKETKQGLEVTFFGKQNPYYTGKSQLFTTYSETVVASSNGAVERRYKVRLLIVIGSRRIRAWFTLADRSQQVYPILVGRNVLRGKFVVDVSLGTEAMRENEKQRTYTLKQEVEKK